MDEQTKYECRIRVGALLLLTYRDALAETVVKIRESLPGTCQLLFDEAVERSELIQAIKTSNYSPDRHHPILREITAGITRDVAAMPDVLVCGLGLAWLDYLQGRVLVGEITADEASLLDKNFLKGS